MVGAVMRPTILIASGFITIDLRLDEFNVGENEAVRDGTHCIKVLDHVILTTHDVLNCLCLLI